MSDDNTDSALDLSSVQAALPTDSAPPVDPPEADDRHRPHPHHHEKGGERDNPEPSDEPTEAPDAEKVDEGDGKDTQNPDGNKDDAPEEDAPPDYQEEAPATEGDDSENPPPS
jgi:hypothetical protein